jgi:hypothetical protein
LRRRQARAGRGLSVFDQIKPNEAGFLLENQRLDKRAASSVCFHGQNIRSADIGVSGER